MTVTNEAKLACVERELSYRRRVYVRLVERGKMTKAQSERELELMRAIVADYRALVQSELLL
jgi:hypothetical protein